MKNLAAVFLLIVCNIAIAQDRRPAYQGYGVPASTSADSTTQAETSAENTAKTSIEAAAENDVQATKKVEATTPEVSDDSGVEVENQLQANIADSEDNAEEPATEPAEELLALPIAETLPLTPEPTVNSDENTPPTNTVGADNISNTGPNELPQLDQPSASAITPPAPPVELAPARWQLDLLVFRNGGPQSLRAERWPRNPGRPNIEQFDVAADTSAASLTEVIGRLDNSPSHRLLLQRTIIFDQLPAFLKKRGTLIESTQAVTDSDLIRGHSSMPTPASRYDWPEVLGTVSLKQGQSNSVSVDLLFSYQTALPYKAQRGGDPLLSGGFEITPDTKLYQLGHIRLQQTASATTEKLIYFDNPAIGAIIKLTELEAQVLPPVEAVDEPVPLEQLSDEPLLDNTERSPALPTEPSENEPLNEPENGLQPELELELELELENEIEVRPEFIIETDQTVQSNSQDGNADQSGSLNEFNQGQENNAPADPTATE